MTKSLIQRAAMGMAMSGLMLMATAAHASAWTGIEISHNGAHSHNAVRLQMARWFSFAQLNDTSNTTVITSVQNTGGNSADGNTGGDVEIKTGDATAYISVTNVGGSNVAYVNGCTDCAGDYEHDSDPEYDHDYDYDHDYGDDHEHDSSCISNW